MSTQEADASDTEEPTDEQTEITPATGEMEATVEADVLATALDALQAAYREAVAEWRDDGLVMHTVDPGDVLMVRTYIPAESFEAYDSGAFNTGVRLERMEQIATVGDLTHLSWDPEQYRYDVQSGPVDANLSIIAPDEVRTRQPSQDVWDGTTTEWTTTLDEFSTVLKASKTMGGKVTEITADHDGDWLGLVKNGDNDDVRASFDSADIDAIDSDLRALMSEDYLSEIRKAIPTDTELRMMAKTDWPLIIEYEHNGVEIEFVQAPRLPKN